MIRKLKKGFTLVELVVVIAVVAILAAVSVVSYLGITKKAKESNDKMVIDQFNNVLTSTLALKKKGDIHQLLENLDENAGFDIRTFTPELQGTSFVYYNKDGHESFAYWDNTKQEVVYPKDLQGTKKSTDLWFFDDVVVNGESVTFDDGASHYFKSLSKATTVYVENGGGLDVGEQLVTEINVVNEAAKASGNIVVRTNGGTLKINAPLDTLDHYGDGEVLDITAIAGESYHEYGNFPKASIGQGRIVVEESGEIPAVEITAVPTSTNPVKVETSKDIVVSASPEVVEQLGDNDLENVEVKVTNAQASVVVDEKIKKDNVEAAGKSESDLISITKVSNFTELETAVNSSKDYIMFTDDISYAKTANNSVLNILSSMTIDGNGHTLEGYGKRAATNNFPTIAVNQNGTQKIDLELTNLVVKNTHSPGRPVETRGNLNSLKINNCEILAVGTGANQCLTIGGNQSSAAKIEIENSTLSNTESSGYCIISFNPVLMNITSSTIEGWASLYFKGMDGSAGTYGSVVNVKNSTLTSENIHSGNSNNFSTIVFEDDNVEVNLDSCTLTAKESAAASQTLITYSCIYRTDISMKSDTIIARGQEGRLAYQSGSSYYFHVKDCKVTISGQTSISYGNLVGRSDNNFLVITGGKFSNCSTELSSFIPSGYQVIEVDAMTKEVKEL